ncbi:MAG TPA: hypothetical protein VFT50_05210 [Baekduia sp.]|nr:hypothetical protein [Baekduia sp.]
MVATAVALWVSPLGAAVVFAKVVLVGWARLGVQKCGAVGSVPRRVGPALLVAATASFGFSAGHRWVTWSLFGVAGIYGWAVARRSTPGLDVAADRAVL